ncbi:MAG TPA: sigma-70 family RNA polymerase sigma factor [Phytomonospora sp.]
MSREDDFDAFYLAEMPGLVGYLTKIGGCREDARDCAQHAFTSAYESWARIHTPRAWLYQAARHELYRKRVRARTERRRTESTIGWWSVRTEDVADDDDSAALLSAIAALPTRQREVTALYYAGFKPAEIAEILAISPDAARSSLCCARKTLRAEFEVKGEMA